MSVHSKSSALKRKRETKKKHEQSDDDFESSEEELDLTKECHPIGHYMNDRAEMINQMFTVIRGNKLRAMLPPIFKDCDVEQLKLQCLDQLLGMSERRITCILDGEILDSSSESEESSDQSRSTASSPSRCDDAEDESKTKRRKRKSDRASEEKGSRTEEQEVAKQGTAEQGKTLLEILELEMRARAIRALLNQAGENKQDTDSGTVVDLTQDEDVVKTIIKTEPKTAIDKKVSTFEEKVDNSQMGEKKNKTVEVGQKRRQDAELELRNKLFKKKMYRSRQQRLDNEEDDTPSSKEPDKLVAVKQEVQEVAEPIVGDIVVDDPEEGEVSSSEDEVVAVKKEPVEEGIAPPDENGGEEEHVRELEQGAERITAMDNGAFIPQTLTEATVLPAADMLTQETADPVAEAVEGETPLFVDETGTQLPAVVVVTEAETVTGLPSAEAPTTETQPTEVENYGETSWRGRWLQKDGVQKLVKTSKMYSKVKERIRNADKKDKDKVREETQETRTEDSDSNSSVPPPQAQQIVEGSVQHYKTLTTANEEGEGSATPQ